VFFHTEVSQILLEKLFREAFALCCADVLIEILFT